MSCSEVDRGTYRGGREYVQERSFAWRSFAHLLAPEHKTIWPQWRQALKWVIGACGKLCPLEPSLQVTQGIVCDGLGVTCQYDVEGVSTDKKPYYHPQGNMEIQKALEVVSDLPLFLCWCHSSVNVGILKTYTQSCLKDSVPSFNMFTLFMNPWLCLFLVCWKILVCILCSIVNTLLRIGTYLSNVQDTEEDMVSAIVAYKLYNSTNYY